MSWGTPTEVERRKRILAALYAYAYEFENTSLVSDGEYDALCLSINPLFVTGHKKLDKFFSTKFDPSTGMWVREHPELKKLKELYEKVKHYYEAR